MENAKYLDQVSEQEYREEFQQRLDRISRIPHITEDARQELINDMIQRYDRINAEGCKLIEGIVTKRQIDSATKN